jgi:lipoprotein-releasing system permease protein
VGTIALVIALALMAGFVEDVRARIHSGAAHLTVMNAHGSPFDGAVELIRRTEAVPGVEAAAAVLYTPAMLTGDGTGRTGFAELHGISPEAHARVVHGAAYEDSPFLLLDRPSPGGREGIVLGAELALSVGLFEGDLVRVLVPQVTLTPWAPVPRSRVFEVVGTYESGHFQHDAQRAYVGLAAAGRLLRAAGGSSWVEVRLDDLRRLEPMKLRLREALGSPWLVIDLIEQNQDILRALNTEKLVLFLAIFLIVVVAATNIFSTLILMVSDKVREIGTLTALGARSGGIASVFMLQGLVIGVVGALSGLLAGTAIVTWLDRYQVIKLDPDVYYLNYVPFSLQPLDLVLVGLAGLLISFVATIYPALKAANLSPVEAIRNE